jgi:hypothetical protein
LSEITWGTATAALAAPFVFLLPGWALLSLLLTGRVDWQSSSHHRLDFASWLILAAGLTLAMIPVLLLVFYLLGLTIRPGVILAGLAASTAIILWRQGPAWHAWLRQRRSWRERFQWLDAPFLALVLVVVLVLGVRLWIVRGINYGFWGDSYQHTMITQLILDNGGLFQSWAPYAPLRTFTYHFGFHSNVAFFQWATGWLTGNSTSRTVVLVGQFLNGMAVLGLYPLAVRLSGGRRWTGVVAVLVAGLLMNMPMFYINWGRYTQLAAQVMLPIALWFLVEALEFPGVSPRRWVLAGLVLGGLGLSHYRIVFFVPCFLLPFLFWRAWRVRRDLRQAAQVASGLVVTGGISLVIVAPWLWNLFNGAYPAITAAVVTDPNAGTTLNQAYLYQDFARWVPWPLVTTTVLGTVMALWRRSAMILVASWLALLFLLANPHWLGLPGTGLVDNFTVFIGLYMPVSLLTGYVLGEGVAFARQQWHPAGMVALLLIAVVGLAAVHVRATVLDPQFQVMTEADAEAMRWIRANTPADARFLVNSFFAFADHYIVGSDGGWWIPLLTGRGNTVPPLLYTSEAGVDPDYLNDVNALARHVEDANLDDPVTVAWLEGQGIRYVYIGAQGGRINEPDEPLLDDAALQSSPYYKIIYYQDGVWIFQVLFQGGSSD